VNVFSYVATLAAYRDGQPWLDDLLRYLEANRDFLVRYVADHLPGITMTKPEGTYLAWLDCRGAKLPKDDPSTFFLERAKVALNDGAMFGMPGRGFARLNFACPRTLLTEALERMRGALASRERARFANGPRSRRAGAARIGVPRAFSGRCGGPCSRALDLVRAVNVFGYVATLAAYRDGQPWLDDLLRYLEANRDFLAQYVADNLPGITMAKPEGTYLAWLDCRGASCRRTTPSRSSSSGRRWRSATARRSARRAGVRAAQLRVSARAPHRRAGADAAVARGAVADLASG
jgi:bifunctional pyridoxal-dependent enzyme with beta-cystathionase and maltose regulon repressor activities